MGGILQVGQEWKAAAGSRFCIICLGSFLGLAAGSSTPHMGVHTVGVYTDARSLES